MIVLLAVSSIILALAVFFFIRNTFVDDARQKLINGFYEYEIYRIKTTDPIYFNFRNIDDYIHSYEYMLFYRPFTWKLDKFIKKPFDEL